MSETKITIPSLSRTLSIQVSIDTKHERKISAALFKNNARKSSDMLAYIDHTLDDRCRVRINREGDASIWFGGTALDIPTKEAQHAADALAIKLVDERTTQSAA
jgi:hypothetical protein